MPDQPPPPQVEHAFAPPQAPPGPGSKPTMFPSLAALSTRAGMTEYLSTTFALTDPAVASAFGEFLQDPANGIYRGPYARVRLPFLPVEAGWVNPLGWLPSGFRPYRHQAAAFERLSTVTGSARPTVVTTGTGSGKTEAFLYPLLDHARRARERGEGGIKAIILYPMNALVTDQAKRIAGLLAKEPALAGVTAGVYIGGDGSHATMGADHLIDQREELRANPPDILLTNYRMLDLLLLREVDAPLWRASATSLAFIVLDEFHTYDGAQGTDVAMLLRRLGATLGVAGPGRPLGRIVPVATSATLGTQSRSVELRAFAETVFGCAFDADAVVSEERHEVEDLFGELDFAYPMPGVADVLAAPLPTAAQALSWQPLAQVFLGQVPADEVALGDALRGHILTRAVAAAVGKGPLPVDAAVREVAKAGALSWGAAAASDPEGVAEALMRFLALVSVARQRDGGRLQPLLNVEIQVWVRGISRVLRQVSEVPRFGWWSDGSLDTERLWLPAVYCRACGSAGWQALATELGEAFEVAPVKVWQSALRDPTTVRTLMPCEPGTPEAQRLDTATCALGDGGDLPVLVTPDADAAGAGRCPACAADDAIRFIGTSVSTLVSVGLTQLFGLPSVPESEKKTLVFTDSVQDAAHRAGFVEGRAFQFNFRSAVLRAVGDQPSTLADVSDRLCAMETEDLYLLAPPDFTRRLGYTGEFLRGDRGGHRRRLLATRLAFQTQLEVGLRSRVGRTLELTGAMGVNVAVDLPSAAALAAETHRNLPVLGGNWPEPETYQFWLQGVFDRLRVRGGIMHPWLVNYIKEDGNRWPIWGASPRGMQKFPRGVSAPIFFTTGRVAARRVATRRTGDFDSLSTAKVTWLTDWTSRCLGIPAAEAGQLLTEVLRALATAEDSPLMVTTTASGSTVYGLRPGALVLTRGSDDDATAGRMQLRCGECRHVQPVSPETAAGWVGSPCPRMRCEGRLEPAPLAFDNFYRRLYLSGTLRRIVAAEHTGLLDRAEREEIEAAFKSGDSPTDPNVLACTPTLELGIDIGDLSNVTLSSLPRTPASYTQRVGRAGRSTGNALVLATVPTGPRDLYFFADPLTLIAGDVVPPSTYLDATELLHRQFLAFVLDRAAAGQLPAGVPGEATGGALPGGAPRQLGALFHDLLAPGTWLRALTNLVSTHADELSQAFLALFGGHLAAETQASVVEYARVGLAEAVARVGGEWAERRAMCFARVGELNAAIAALDAKGRLDDIEALDLRGMRGERAAQLAMANEMGNQETFTGLSGLSLLPNYNLIDDSTTLDVSLWWVSDDADEVQHSEFSYQRGSRVALSEFAPGATFYARGQKVTVDALEPGPVANPLWVARRLCPSCGWGAPDASPIGACPRCGDTAIADVGSVHKVLPFKEASAQHSRDEALIDEEREDRSRRRFVISTAVDIERQHVRQAWRLTGLAFGAEYATRAVVRTVNLGPASEQGAPVSVAGERHVKTAFLTCAHCGKWWKDGQEEQFVRHRGWCPTRKGTPAQWQDLVLSHELVTQAVRMLLPVSVFDHTEHLVAMKGALLLGLRADFGGDPQHLDVVTATMRDAQGRPRRFLVLHDTVPGGTGYLDRIGDPERLYAILVKARAQLASCRCRTESRAACHRCLLSVVSGSEIEHADRALAVRLLDEVLGAWQVQSIATVADIDITNVHLSELEKRFRAALMAWVATLGEHASTLETMGPKGMEIDLTLPGEVDGVAGGAGGATGLGAVGGFGAAGASGAAGRGSADGAASSGLAGASTRWRLRPLVQVVAQGVACEPDFLLARQDAPSAPVAIFLDGREFHASPGHNRTDDDAWKRDALRADGYRVFSITWDDVAQFESMIGGGRAEPFNDLVPQQVQQRALGVVGGGVGAHRVAGAGGQGGGATAALKLAWGNPILMLFAYLRDPDSPAWEEAVLALLNGLMSVAKPEPQHLDPASLHRDLWRVAVPNAEGAGGDPGGPDAPAGAAAPPLLWAARLTPDAHAGEAFTLVLFSARDRGTAALSALAVLDDSDAAVGSPAHRAGWVSWLHWSNVLQFLAWPLPKQPMVGRAVAIWTTTGRVRFESQYLPHAVGVGAAAAVATTPASAAAAGAGFPETQPATLPAEWQKVADAADPALRGVIAELAAGGVAVPEVGEEVNDSEWIVELAWPDVHLAVVIDDEPERDAWLAEDGWRVLSATGQSRDAAAADVAARIAEELAVGT